MVKVIGITGSIAVGKSTVTRYLLMHGYQVLDADKISKEALNVGTACYNKVVSLFNCVNDDLTIDRKALGAIVFSDALKKKQLEDIIHPHVLETLNKGIKECEDELIFLDIPLLFEAKLEYLCDKIIVVYVDENTQMHRLMERNHIDEDAAMHLMKQQMSIEDKKKLGDYIIDNRFNHEDLYKNIERVLKEIKDEIIHA